MTASAPHVLDRGWDLAPQVSVRPESFGALLYHFGTRRLSFVKDVRLLKVLQLLDVSPTARDACRDAGIDGDEAERFGRALTRLADTQMLAERVA
jgi:mycofactocin biosynthesis protein MftB